MPRPKRSGASPLEHHPLGNALHDGTVLLISVWCLRHSGISSLGVLGTAGQVFTKAQPTSDWSPHAVGDR
jgi:hypothetical protein